jgi:hypothetical protein
MLAKAKEQVNDREDEKKLFIHALIDGILQQQ